MIGKISYLVSLREYKFTIITPDGSVLGIPAKLPAFRFPSYGQRTLITSTQNKKTRAQFALKDYLPGNTHQEFELRSIHQSILSDLERGIKKGKVFGAEFFRRLRKVPEINRLRAADIVVQDEDGDDARTSFWYEVPVREKRERLAGLVQKVGARFTSLSFFHRSRSSFEKLI
jgi:hypothetical protein